MGTVVSRVSAHVRSIITPRFSVYWALTWDTGHLPCVKIEIGGADCVGVATTKHVRLPYCACHIALVAACLGAYPGVGACHIVPGAACLGAYPGYYGTYLSIAFKRLVLCNHSSRF